MSNEEIWKDIKDFEGMYQISNFGRLKSFKHRKPTILKCETKKEGYRRIVLCVDKTNRKRCYIHRLVAIAFLEKPHGKDFVNHINEDKGDNRSINLEWVTSKQNANHGTRNKRVAEKLKTCSLCRKVKMFDINGKLIKTWNSLSDANNNGYHSSEIKKCSNGVYETYKGYRWEVEKDLLYEDVRKRSAEKIKNKLINNKYTSKPIIRISKNGDIKNYKSISEAGREGYSTGNIGMCCKNMRKTHKGYRWEYLKCPN